MTPARPRADAASVRAAREERRTRALEEPLDVRLRAREPYPLLEVRNPIHGTVYRVMLPEYPSRSSALCTCTDFARRGLGTCKHLEAAARWLDEHPDAAPAGTPAPRRFRPAALWRRIDAAIAAERRRPGLDPRRVRRPGALLFQGTEN